MKLHALVENIEQAGQEHLVISVWSTAGDNRAVENFYVISDVPPITRLQYHKLYNASFKTDDTPVGFGRQTNIDLLGYHVDLTPYNLVDVDDDGDTIMKYKDWPNHTTNLSGEKVKEQSFTTVKWKDLVRKVIADHPSDGDDFD